MKLSFSVDSVIKEYNIIFDQFNCLDEYTFFLICSVKVLFTFDKGFNSAFGAEGRTQVMALVKNAFKDSSIVGRIGTSVNIIPTAKTYSGTYTDSDL